MGHCKDRHHGLHTTSRSEGARAFEYRKKRLPARGIVECWIERTHKMVYPGCQNYFTTSNKQQKLIRNNTSGVGFISNNSKRDPKVINKKYIILII